MLSVSTQLAREDDLLAFARMLQSVKFADEIRIYAMNRHDTDFKRLVETYQAVVVDIDTPKIVETIRNRQIKEASGDWVLIMDFDEIITPRLAKEIQVTIAVSEAPPYTWEVRRKNFSLGYALSHGGWGDDRVPRLFRKEYFLDWPSEIHGKPKVTGGIGKLQNHMEHHKDASVEQMVAKTNRYSDIEAQQFFDGELPPVTILTLLRKPLMELLRRALLKGGILDGKIGVIQSIYQSFSVFISYAKLYEKQHNKK
jgi:(heptosyl)LPS beta-1,4-glucosyltransferase